MAEDCNKCMNVRVVNEDESCDKALCVKVCNLTQEVRKTGASNKLIPSEKAVSDALKGRQESLVAGAAEGILGPSAATGLAQVLTAPSAGVSIVDAIKGRTLKWNQKINTAALQVDDRNGLTFTPNADGTITVSGIASANTLYKLGASLVSGRKYVVAGGAAGGSNSTYRINAHSTAITDATSASLYESAYSGSDYPAIQVFSGTDLTTPVTFRPQLFDVTDAFGAGNEPATTDAFTALFQNFPYAYNAGTLLPFKGTGIKVTGQNQWDEQWELGNINASTGADVSDNTNIRSTYQKAVQGATYYINSPNSLRFWWYDSQKNAISGGAIAPGTTQVVPAGAAYFRFGTTNAYGTTYAGDICINLSNASLNGTYKPYTETLVNIDAIGKSAKDGNDNAIVPFPTGVNGVGTVLDMYDKEGGIKRLGVAVNLSSLTWTGSTGNWITTDLAAVIKKRTSANDVPNAIASAAYTPKSQNTDSGVAGSGDLMVNTAGAIQIRSNASPTGSLVYELATPVPFTWDEPFTLAFTAEEGGTIWLQPEGVDEAGVPATAPLNADIAYTIPAGQVINATTLDNLLDALKTAGVISAYTMTPDGNGNYTFTITA